MKRKSIASLVFVIDGIGLNIFGEKTIPKIWRYICCMALFIYANFTFIMYSSSHRNKFFEAASPIIYIGGSNIMMVGVLAILHRKQTLRQMLINMDNGMFAYPDEHRIPVNYPWFLKEKNNVQFYYVVLLVVLFAYSLLLTMAIVQLVLNKQITIFIYPNWTPWAGEGVTYQITSLILQHVTVLCGLWFYYIVCMFLIGTAIESARQVERLCAAIRSLSQRTKLMASVDDDNKIIIIQDENFQREIRIVHESARFRSRFDAILKQNIIHCSKHHQVLMKNHQIFRAVFQIIYSFELACSLLTLSLGLYYIVYAPDFELVLNSFVVVLVVNTNFFTRCFIGEQFAELNIKLRNTLFYESSWYEQTAENKQLLLMLHGQVSCAFKLNGFSIFQASLRTFTSIIRSAYSFFNVLQRSVK